MGKEITTELLHKLCRDDTIYLTQHLQLRCMERGIGYSDIKHAIMSGEIIELYPEDYPHPSCLILGGMRDGRKIHVVTGVGGGFLWIVTAYFPDTTKWCEDLRTRREAAT